MAGPPGPQTVVNESWADARTGPRHVPFPYLSSVALPLHICSPPQEQLQVNGEADTPVTYT